MALTNKEERRARIKRGIRGKITGTADRPRMTVYRSNKNISVQIIDDGAGVTIASASSLALDEKSQKVIIASKIGEIIANKAKDLGITNIVFDRNGYLYHGRIKELAEAARKAGLKF